MIVKKTYNYKFLIYHTLLRKNRNKYIKSKLVKLFYKFYKIIFQLLKVLVIRYLINSSMFLSNSKYFTRVYSSNYFFKHNNNLILNFVSTLFIFRKLLTFFINILQNGGYFLICNFENKFLFFEYKELLEFMLIIPQSLVFGMPFGGLLTNQNKIIKKLANTKYSVNELKDVAKELNNKIFYCERMVYNKYFRKNYFINNNLPSGIILLDLHSFLYCEAVILKIPIIGLVNSSNIFNSVTYPLFINNQGLFPLFLFFMFLNKIFTFSFYLEVLNYKWNLLYFYKNSSILKWGVQLNKIKNNFFKLKLSRKQKKQRWLDKSIETLKLRKFFKSNLIFKQFNNTYFKLKNNLVLRKSFIVKNNLKYKVSLLFYNFFYYKELLFLNTSQTHSRNWFLLRKNFYLKNFFYKNFIYNQYYYVIFYKIRNLFYKNFYNFTKKRKFNFKFNFKRNVRKVQFPSNFKLRRIQMSKKKKHLSYSKKSNLFFRGREFKYFF